MNKATVVDLGALTASVQEAVDAWVGYYQPLLRLQDWDLDVKILRQHDMASPTALGMCQAVEMQRRASIQLRHPIDADPSAPETENDLELTLVHELLHVVLCVFRPDPDSAKHLVLEQGLDAIAGALVTQRRALQPEDTESEPCQEKPPSET